MIRKDLVQRSFEWQEFRKKGIGSTDISIICGVNPYKKIKDLFKEKKEGTVSEPLLSEAIKRGNTFEDQVRKQIEKAFHLSFEPVVAINEDHPYFFASLDGYNEKENEILEIKVPLPHNFERYLDNDIPRYIEYQLQWQLYNVGGERGWLVIYSPELQYHHHIRIYRDENIIKEMVRKGCEFWNSLQADNFVEEGFITVNAEEAKEIAERWKQANREEKKLKSSIEEKLKELKRIKEKTKQELIEFGDDGDFIIWGIKMKRHEGPTRWDIEKMKKDNIDYEKYIIKTLGSYRASEIE